MSASYASNSADLGRTERLPQFQVIILRWFFAFLSVLDCNLLAPALLLLSLPFPLLLLLLLLHFLRGDSTDGELKLGARTPSLPRVRNSVSSFSSDDKE